MPAEALKPMDGEMQSAFFLLYECEIRNLTLIVCFFLKVCSVRWSG
jgi:hypothetical protein